VEQVSNLLVGCCGRAWFTRDQVSREQVRNLLHDVRDLQRAKLAIWSPEALARDTRHAAPTPSLTCRAFHEHDEQVANLLHVTPIPPLTKGGRYSEASCVGERIARR